MGLQLRLQIIILITVLLTKIIGAVGAPALVLSGCRAMCGRVRVPYPFGLEDRCSGDTWFTIDCNNSKPFLKRLGLEVLQISLKNGTILVNYPVLYSNNNNCSAAGGGINRSVLVPDLNGSLFFFSETDNIFAAVGCNKRALITQKHFNSSFWGCDSTCAHAGAGSNSNNCSGINCCSAPIPAHLQFFNVTWSRIPEAEADDSGCAYAFLVQQDYWIGHNLANSNPFAVNSMENLPAMMDWYHLNKTYYYMSPIYCASTIVYRGVPWWSGCRCPFGYEGNPYFTDGCRDINECTNSTLNTCGKHCVNLPGSYRCDNKYKMIIIGVCSGLGSLLLLACAWWLYIVLKRRNMMKRRQKFFKRNGGLLLQQQLSASEGGVDKTKLFNTTELETATDNFNENRVLGRGGQGTVYKGMLTDGRIVAIKKSKMVDEANIDQFINEVVIVSQINHRNVVKLLGCCLETEVPLLVYEFVSNGTLFQHIHDPNEELPLSWEMCLRILAEIAGALYYLHSAASIPIYHRDIKSTNILLDHKYTAKVSDFGTSRSVAVDQTHLTTIVQGTFGYLDPEYFQSSQFTDKSDVYSFGVVMVEILTREKPISSTRSENCRSLTAYFIQSMEENRLFEILDPRVAKEGRKEELVAVANLAKRCLHLTGKRRPTMKEVAMELEGIRMSQGGSTFQQNCEEVECITIELSEAWGTASTSTTSRFNIEEGSPLDVQPLLF
ncbi:hypothetical protein F0562_032337 [Nyssa sinensis]|uniref:Protein kinase domain-containing protein n=1 Tax=Nyssa sinensis TaxID=561372 RepID=A0A5J5APS5_9ASTE|nr:hypothetical protein F0562_032337 [Nyssa sinensis]